MTERNVVDRNVVLVGFAAMALTATIGAVSIGDALLLRSIQFPDRDQKASPPNDSSSFFSDRNTVRIQVPYAMTANDLISMYKLEQSRLQIL